MDTEAVAGVAGQPQPSDYNGCDTIAPSLGPAKSAGNPRQCRTSDPIHTLDSLQRRHPEGEIKVALCVLMATVKAWLDPTPFPQDDYANRLRLSNNIRRQRARLAALGVEV